jgi:hypothetical protein
VSRAEAVANIDADIPSGKDAVAGYDTDGIDAVHSMLTEF